VRHSGAPFPVSIDQVRRFRLRRTGVFLLF
jgi:hypothetical protein